MSTNIYVGANIYAKFPVIRHVIDLGILQNWPSVKLGDSFINGLLAALPGLENRNCSSSTFALQLRENNGIHLGHIWEHVIIELQNIAGSQVVFGKTLAVPGEKSGLYNMAFAYQQKDVGLNASDLARDLLLTLLPAKLREQIDVPVIGGFDFAQEKIAFIKFAQSKEFGPSTASLVNAAKERDIPYIRLNDQSLVQFGHGKYQKRIRATITSQTKDIAVDISCDKETTNKLLDSLGLPVPRQQLVRNAEAAVVAAKQLGYPVVVKPLDGNHGRGISIDLKADDEIIKGFEVARDVSSKVLVEKFITGFDHRMCVVDGKLVAAAKRVPGHVVGDGKHTIAQLVDIVNQDPRRGVGHEKALTRLELDYQAQTLITKAGYAEDTVLKEGEVLYLRDTANLSTGGTAIDVTDIVHPDNRSMAERAILAVGLDVGGVDFLTPDISRSYLDVGGAICEVNAAPGFRMHVSPSEGKPRDVAGAVMNMLFPNPKEARIPIVAITGTNGKTTTSRMVAHMWKTAGRQVGLTTTDGIYVNSRMTVAGDTTGPVSAQMILRDPSIDLAVFETARGGLLRSGLGYDYCNVGACINVTADHMGLGGVNTLDDLARVKRIVVEAARDVAILNADDVQCLKMSSYTEAKFICYITINAEHDLVKEHIRAGGKAVILEKGLNGSMITIYDNHMQIPVLWTHLIPATIEGKAMHNVQNAMFAVAICYNMGMTLDNIKDGLLSFATSYSQVPGRLNIFDEHPFKVLMDYAHNPAALKMIGELAQKMEVRGKRTLFLSAPGDRRDQDILETAQVAAAYFDNFIIKQDDGLRGRANGDVPALLKKGLITAGISEDKIIVILSENEGVDYALNHAEDGDLLVLLADNIKRSWKQVTQFKSAKPQIKSLSTGIPKKIIHPSNLSPELNALIKAGIISDERGVRLVLPEDTTTGEHK